ncbi:hypothetical protein Tco_0549622 [Tanacetum coccineum]
MHLISVTMKQDSFERILSGWEGLNVHGRIHHSGLIQGYHYLTLSTVIFFSLRSAYCETPTSGNEASGSGKSSGSKRVFIDLDDIDGEEDKEGRANKTPKLLTVKVEKEDP